MSEPQHPFGTDGTETNAGRSGSDGSPSPVQAVPDTLAAVGARLAQLRQAKNWSVEDVSARLKVSVSKLRELEAGDISHLPDATFALGVVRAYAKLLGADPAPLTQALRRERGVPQPDLSMPASSGADLPRGRVSLSLGGGVRTPRRRASWLWGVAFVVVAVIGISMWHTNSGESSAWFARLKSMASGTTSSASSESGASSATVAEGTATGAATGQGTDEAGAASNAQASGQVNGQVSDEASAVQGAASAPQATASAPQAAQVAPASAAPAASAATASAAAVAGVATAATEQAASVPAATGTSTFAIRVTQDSWVSVRQKDGKELFSGLVHANDGREVAGVEPLRITVGNKAGIESMTIDGQPVDASKYASARGNVARFVLP
ncbi:helix-turn-helix domain-containing protein [Paraburkholderia pallida]|uniref:Helix-turn-helix domain-containing protein n=1 Tax=Paraburkholderia pallida TaxID=2547399 RepID=A0A4P7CV47_9BURK|nr:helix-turn-helix domain-containing protein [Paraburkholderia pallida]QBQ97803.1 helix-turn-helix domain-containing protein [Paraburkholderia pallida]